MDSDALVRLKCESMCNSPQERLRDHPAFVPDGWLNRSMKSRYSKLASGARPSFLSPGLPTRETRPDMQPAAARSPTCERADFEVLGYVFLSLLNLKIRRAGAEALAKAAGPAPSRRCRGPPGFVVRCSCEVSRPSGEVGCLAALWLAFMGQRPPQLSTQKPPKKAWQGPVGKIPSCSSDEPRSLR